MGLTVITGANRGIGLEFVRQYLSEGRDLIATYRSDPGDLAILQRDYGRLMETRQLDVANVEQFRSFMGSLEGRAIDLLINNAGIYPNEGSDSNLDDSLRTWIDGFTTNTIAPLLLSRTLLPLLEKGKEKKIVVLSSKMGSIADNTSGGSYPYRSSKAATNAAFKSLAVDLAPKGIAVGILHPGWVQTDMGGPNALIDTRESVTGMRRVIAELTVANSGRFIAYDGAEISW